MSESSNGTALEKRLDELLNTLTALQTEVARQRHEIEHLKQSQESENLTGSLSHKVDELTDCVSSVVSLYLRAGSDPMGRANARQRITEIIAFLQNTLNIAEKR